MVRLASNQSVCLSNALTNDLHAAMANCLNRSVHVDLVRVHRETSAKREIREKNVNYVNYIRIESEKMNRSEYSLAGNFLAFSTTSC